ncbi:MAG TPA: recombination mediator RecR [Saprospiraceae bacterium]|nr:recombination mediator RecR [Saprospiraceae bacterium]
MKFSSKIIEDLVNQFSTLPGVGKKSALRMALHMAKQPQDRIQQMSQSLLRLSRDLRQCKECHAYADTELCEICMNPTRDRQLLCVVESIKDVLAIEETSQFKGVYHILGGIISPIDGIGPNALNIDSLQRRLFRSPCKELIFALRPSIEGETTAYYISRNLQLPYEIKYSQLARGISFGSDLEFADELTLARSILARTPYSIQDQLLTG